MGKDCGDGGCGGRVTGLNPSLCCWFDCVGFVNCRGSAEAFSERLKRELHALEAANVHFILESEPLVDEVYGLVFFD
ncbi:hypothetical protein LXL04_028379 [Taraxacum kok-saghyz]